jgi:hypothetical protein
MCINITMMGILDNSSVTPNPSGVFGPLISDVFGPLISNGEMVEGLDCMYLTARTSDAYIAIAGQHPYAILTGFEIIAVPPTSGNQPIIHS